MQQAKALLTTRREEDTAYIGEMLGRLLAEPMVVALQGELGAGKTVFVRGAARGLEVEDQVSSPTFVLMKMYEGHLPVYHFDFYRLTGGADEADELLFEEYLPGDGIAFIEWPERLPELLPPDYLLIIIELFHDQFGENRRLNFIPHGSAASKVVETLFEEISWRTDGSLNREQPGS